MADSAIGPAGLLSGIRILDLTRLLPGPAATQQLADLGAEVLKIEEPRGDPARHMGRPAGNSAEFQAVNRHKRFATLDLRQAAGRARLLDLAREADALVENFRPGTLERMGLGWPELSALNPRLVLCSISGYGQDGPYAQRAGHDINYLALAGALHQLAEPDGRPVLPGLPLADMMGAQAAATGVVAALLRAARDGRGVHLDVALADAVLGANPLGLAACHGGRQVPAPGSGLLTGGAPCYDVYRCADGKWLAVGALELKFWQALVGGLDLPALAGLHWSLGLAVGGEPSRVVRAQVAERFASRPREAWLATLEPLDCCVTPVLRLDEALRHPAFLERQASGVWPATNVPQASEALGAGLPWVAPAPRVMRPFVPQRRAQPLGTDDPANWIGEN